METAAANRMTGSWLAPSGPSRSTTSTIEVTGSRKDRSGCRGHPDRDTGRGPRPWQGPHEHTDGGVEEHRWEGRASSERPEREPGAPAIPPTEPMNLWGAGDDVDG